MTINTTTTTTRHKIEVQANQVTVQVVTHAAGTKAAAYLLLSEDNYCIERRWYQSSGTFVFEHLPAGSYHLQLFLMEQGKKKSWKTNVFQVQSNEKNHKAELLITEILAGKHVSRNIKTLIETCQPYLQLAFQRLMGAAHGSFKWHRQTDYLRAAIGYLENKAYCPSQALFLLTSIIYIGSEQDLRAYEHKLLSAIAENTELPAREINYLSGLLRYKLGDFYSAEVYFQGLLPFAHSLKYYQGSSPSYFYRWQADPGSTRPSRHWTLVKKCSEPNNGVVLISCDYGYFSSYGQTTIKKLLANKANVHLHLILPPNFNIRNLPSLIQTDADVGVSYEVETQAQADRLNRKTYYSVARYLICSDIINLYHAPVLVADIDINFEMSISNLFKKIGDSEIALVFGRSNLPWLRIMAGFNIFGRNTGDGAFLSYLAQLINFCLNTGRDGWMLDQTALEVTYENLPRSEKSRIRPMSDILDHSVRQYENRAKFRAMARKAIASLPT